MFKQLSGVLALQPDVFRSIAADPRAARRAWGIVIAVTCLTAVGRAIAMQALPDDAAPFPLEVGRWLLLQLPVNLFSWLIGAALLQWIAGRVFGAAPGWPALLRVYGHIRIFAVVGVLGALVPDMVRWLAVVFVVVVLHVAAAAAALQALCGLSRGRAVTTAAISVVLGLLLAIAALLALISLVMFAAVSLGLVAGT